ncbi:acyltransferase [Sphingopyxis sp. CCNWLW253]|uniref:acyltransferase family protein n=1 Tax=unclassified Sphingopyxis TaxID=2614943 RepID=UPI003012B0AB
MDHPPKRLLRLDGLRGVAACIVSLIFHARLLFGGQENPLDGLPVIMWFQTWGWSMVDLFFVLSGFVFAHCYLDRWRMRSGTTASGFAVSRFARLWPLHAITLAFTIAVTINFPDTTWCNSLLSLLMLHVFVADPTHTLNSPAWSLSVEVLCYAVFCLAAIAGTRFLQAAMLVAMVFGVYSIAEFGVWNSLVGRGFLGFFGGVLLCQSKGLADRIPNLVLAPLAALPFIIVPDGAWLILAILIAWPAAILLALRSEIMEARPLVWLGERSYAIYLLHVPIYIMSWAILSGLTTPTQTLGLIAVLPTWAVIILAADFLYRRVERPYQKAILERFERRALNAPKLATVLRETDRRFSVVEGD